MKTYNGIYLGIVIQNNDPEFRGRVKIFVPHISAVLYDRWNKQKRNRKFKFPGQNITSDLTQDIMDELKAILPWAEQLSPNAGATGSGRYHSSDNTATVSDSNIVAKTQPVANPNPLFAKYKLNTANMGEKAGKIYEAPSTQIEDAFTSTANGAANVNKYGTDYKPNTYSNAAKGSFSIPNVGSHVWVFFREGNPAYPVYMGASLGRDDFKGIFGVDGDAYQDYPQSYENISSADRASFDHNSDIYRNKYVFNQKGGVIEIINTDGREAFNLTHFSGSYLGFNNKAATLLATRNFQTLVLGDTFQTFRGTSNIFVGNNQDLLINGDHLIKIGNINSSAFQVWHDIYKDVHDLKKLFEIRRVEQDGTFATISHLGQSILSPSTQDGVWAPQSSKEQIVQLIQQKTKQLADAEAKMGRGGSEIKTITKHKMEIIGLVMNDYESIRIDPVGKLSDYATTITGTGVYHEQAASPLVEYVDAQTFPAGSFTQIIANKYKGIVGSGGYEVKSTGPVDISGSITNLIGSQVNVVAKNEVTIDGGKRLNLIADIITLSQRAGKQVNVPTNFGVSKNQVIRGGLHVEGELSVQHITAPVEWQVTEPTHIKTTFTIRNVSITNTNVSTPGGADNDSVTGGIMTGEIELDIDHTHYFRNIPLALLDTEASVRNDAASKVNADSVTARGHKAVSDGKRGGGSMRPAPVDNGPNSDDYGNGSNPSDG